MDAALPPAATECAAARCSGSSETYNHLDPPFTACIIATGNFPSPSQTPFPGLGWEGAPAGQSPLPVPRRALAHHRTAVMGTRLDQDKFP